MIYVTGDIHGALEIERLSGKNWKEGKKLCKQDYLIVVGDFGLLWKDIPDEEEMYWLQWLHERPWTTLFIDGNHENHNRLDELPSLEMFGGVVGKVNDSIFHLRRGEVYNIAGKKFFCFGGAFSNDFDYRLNQVDWWPQEIPSVQQFEYGMKKLKEQNYIVDFLLFHTIPQSVNEELQSKKFNPNDPTCKMLQEFKDKCVFESGYSGHFHIDRKIENWSILYQSIICIG